MRSLALPILILLAGRACPQDMKAAERDLLARFGRIAYWGDYSRGGADVHRDDSLGKANLDFQGALRKLAADHPESLQYEFVLLQDSGVMIATSDDHRLRIYSWDSELGGTERDFLTVCQYQSGRGVRVDAGDTTANIDVTGYGGFCTPIYTVHTPGRTYYLVVNQYILSNKDVTQDIEACSIHDGALDCRVKLFKTKTGLHDGIRFDFDFLALEGHPERPVQLIGFDPVQRVLRIPVVMEDGTVTKRSIVYRWTGHYFERQ